MPSPTPKDAKNLSEFPVADKNDAILEGWGQDSGGSKIIDFRDFRNSFIGVTADIIASSSTQIHPDWIVLNGQTVSRLEYPLLAPLVDGCEGFTVTLTSITVPSLFRRFPMMDIGSSPCGTLEDDSIQNITGSFSFTDNNDTSFKVRGGAASGAFYLTNVNASKVNSDGVPSPENNAGQVNFDASRVARASSETKPKTFLTFKCIRGR